MQCVRIYLDLILLYISVYFIVPVKRSMKYSNLFYSTSHEGNNILKNTQWVFLGNLQGLCDIQILSMQS